MSLALDGLRDLIILKTSDSVTFLMLKVGSVVLTGHISVYSGEKHYVIVATESIKYHVNNELPRPDKGNTLSPPT